MCTSAGIDIPKENREPGSLAAKLQRRSIDAWSNVDLTSEQNCNQNGPVLKENYAKPHPTGAQQASIYILWQTYSHTVMKLLWFRIVRTIFKPWEGVHTTESKHQTS